MNERTVLHPRHKLTIDVGGHFHASRFASPVRRRLWSAYSSRIACNTDRVLKLCEAHEDSDRHIPSSGSVVTSNQ